MSEALSPGVIVAQSFEIERLLGRGGMGEVWLARHQRLAGKQVAIKVLHTQGALSNEALARFKREAEIAVRLEHPNIVQVLDFNSLPSGEPFIVMEYLKGESLSARLKRGALSVEETTFVMRQVGSALHAAHAATVVHRDLKPENIFLVPTGLGDQVKVLDFGISKLADSGTMQTTDSVLMGTPLYMSPEQALGHNSDVTPQSDVFTLGSITYECLTGKAPFEADNIAKVVFRIAYEPHAPLRTLAPHVPEAMANAVEHALAKDRSQRTASVAAFVLELTGQVLANTGTNPAFVPKPSGVLTPGAKVDEQMMAGATMARPSQAFLATPNPTARPPVEPASSPAPLAAAPSSRLGLIVGGLMAVVGIGVGVGLMLRPVVQAASVDAGVAVALPVQVVDAGVVADAGRVEASAPVALDAGVEDAGVQRPRVTPTPLVPPPANELAVLKRVEADLAAGEVEAVWRSSPALRQKFVTKEGVREYVTLMVEVACRRSDLGSAKTLMRQLEGPPAAFEAARRRCRRFAEFEL